MVPLHLNEHLSASRVLQSVGLALRVEYNPGVLVQVHGSSARGVGLSLAQMADGGVH